MFCRKGEATEGMDCVDFENFAVVIEDWESSEDGSRRP